METWMIIVLCVACVIVGYLIGAFWSFFARCLDGVLVVDKAGMIFEDGVYLQTVKDPQAFKDGQRIVLRVDWFTDKDLEEFESQQKQRS